ncbi:MAG: hypothetical protein HZB76_02115 [Chlamydiae bacterium]|nr:hypothetical protein [Chlamydiota bacterium]
MALFLKYKIKQPKPAVNRLIKLTYVLAASSIIWGCLVGSFFGEGINLKNPLSKYTPINYLALKAANYHYLHQDSDFLEYAKQYPKVKKAKNGEEFLLAAMRKDGKVENFEAFEAFKNNLLLESSLFAGFLHISLGLLRYLKKRWASFGWFVFLIGGYLFFPSVIEATSFVHYVLDIPKEWAFSVGKELVYVGMGLAVLLAIIQKGLHGLSEVLNVVQIFADIMSYSRIYALGVAGTIMASTFNSMGLSFGFSAGILFILVGQTLTLGMSAMGGIIHGLRLNFIEWYHHCFEGDGKLFNPLKLFKM